MKFIGGTAAARKLFEALASDGLLCMPYTDQWMKENAEKLDEDYELFLTSGKNYRNDEGLVFIDGACPEFCVIGAGAPSSNGTVTSGLR